LKKSIIDKFRENYHYSRYKKIKKIITKEKSKKLLDFGCGAPCKSMKDGSFLSYLGYGTGTDVKEANIKFPFRKCTISKIPFPNDSFDIVVTLETLEHVQNLDITLKEIKRVLKKNGTFIVTTPNNCVLWRIIWKIWTQTFGKEWKNSHITKYNKSEWLDKLSKYFKIIKSEELFGLILIAKLKSTL